MGAPQTLTYRWTAQTPLAIISIICQFTFGFPSWIFWLGCYDGNRTILLVNQDSNHPAVATVDLGAPGRGTSSSPCLSSDVCVMR